MVHANPQETAKALYEKGYRIHKGKGTKTTRNLTIMTI